MNVPANLWIQIIIALAAMCTAIFAFLNHRKQRTKIEQLSKEHKDSNNKQKKIIRDLETSIESQKHNPNYSFSIAHQIKTFILKENGDAEIETIYKGLKPNQDFKNLKIPYRFVVDGENADFEKPEVKELNDSDLPVQLQDYTSIRISKNRIKFTGNYTVLGHCEPESCYISFSSKQKVKGGYAKTKSKALELYSNSDWPHEYVSSVVMVRMDTLAIEVKFPYKISDMSGKPFPVVFCNGTYTLHNKETKIVSENFEMDNDKMATLKIEDPTPGLTYAISWMPPDE